MARASFGLAYPERFYVAASYAGFDGSQANDVSSRFQNDTALLLYALYQQATKGPCNVPKPNAWNAIEQKKWQSWQGLGNMATTEAMRLFVKILEEEDPSWYSRAANFSSEQSTETELNKISIMELASEGINSIPEVKIIPIENGTHMETQDKHVASEGIGSNALNDEWVAPPILGHKPRARYEHGAAVIQDKMYVFGGNHNGRYLSDLHFLDLRTWSWSKVETIVEPDDSSILTPCAGHSLIAWNNKVLSIAGHTKNPSETIQVKLFDPKSATWSIAKTYGKPPASRGGQSVSLVGTSIVIFGGQDAKRSLLNDLHILDLETMTWDEIDTVGALPSPRSAHAAAVHAERFLFIFGGGSHASCFNDLHVLDLQSMEWSQPKQQGGIPSARAGHAGVTIGENWFIVGGGDNKSGAMETIVLNMSTLHWSVVTSVKGRIPLASEGLSLVSTSHNGEDILISFGGYNGRYSNEVHLLKPSLKSASQSHNKNPQSIESFPASNSTRDVEPTVTPAQDSVDSLRLDKKDLESSLDREKLLCLKYKQEVADVEARNGELYKELQSVRGQLAVEQSRSFKLEVEVAELRQNLQKMEAMQKELELLQRQKAASEEAALKRRQSGVWNWLAGSPGPQKDDSE